MNRGLHELASANEICGYFDQVMQKQFLPTGRMRYFPLCNHVGDNKFLSLVSGVEYRVNVRKKLVDATYTDTAVPSTHPPQYEIAPEICCIPPNGLPQVRHDHPGYVVIGAGKTGIDACLWLLEHDVPASRICWIMPRDSWLVDRAHFQPGSEFFEQRVGSAALQMELISKSESIEHLFQLLGDAGQLLRLDDNIQPTMFRCATVSRAELEALRQVKNVVRLGRVQCIDPERIVLAQGVIATGTENLHIDCTASGVQFREALPVFDGNRITLQAVRTCQPCISAALIGHVEAVYDDEAEKNRICTAIPYATKPIDWLRMHLANLANQYQWARNGDLRNWLANTRLDVNHGHAGKVTPEHETLVRRFRENAGPAAAKLRRFLT